MKVKARNYSCDKYNPQHREAKLNKVKAYQAKMKRQLMEEYILFPLLD